MRSLPPRLLAALLFVGLGTPWVGTQAVALTPSTLLLGEIVRSVMPAVISIVMLIPSSVVVVSRSRPAEHQRWATAAISSIITYWLR